MRRFVFLLSFISIMLISKVNADSIDRYECAYYPMEDINIIELNGNNSFKLSAGKVYAPFTGVIKRIYDDAVWIESTDPVRITTDRLMYITMLIQNGKEVQELYEGKLIAQGDLFYESTNDIHFELAQGIYSSSSWTFTDGVWTQGKGLSPSDVFWINPLVRQVENKGIQFRFYDGYAPNTLGIYPITRINNTKDVMINPSFDMQLCLSYKDSELNVIKYNENTPRCVLYEHGNGLYKISIDNKFLVVDGDKVQINYGEGALFKIRKHLRGYILSYSENENYVLTYGSTSSISDIPVTLAEYRGTTNQLWAFNRIMFPAFSSILLNTKPYKTEFLSTEEITTDGLTLKEIYNDSTYLIISKGFYIQEEDKRITVLYEKKSVFYAITREKAKEELIILKKPDKLIYIKGEKLNTDGLSVALKRADGTIEAVENYYFRLHNLNSEGVHEITVLYFGKAASFDVLVLKDNVKSIQINTTPNTEYFIYEKLNTEGLTIKVEYADGSYGIIDKDYSCSPIVFDKPGKQLITVIYVNVQTSFEVNIKPISVTDIQIKDLPNRMVYGLEEKLSIGGMSIAVRLSNGSLISKSKGFDVYGFDSKTAGKKTITVSYEGKIATFNVNVIDSKLKGIEICNYPNKTVFTQSSIVDYTGLSISLLYENGDIINATSGFDIQYDFNTTGYSYVIVSYCGFTAKYKVLIEEKEIIKIEVLNTPSRMHYRMFEELNTKGLTIKAYFNDGSTEEIIDGFSVSYDFTTDAKVIVKYNGFETDFNVKVLYSDPDRLLVTYKRYTAYINRPFEKDLLQVLAYYDDGTAYYVDDYDVEYEPNQEDIYVVNVSYGTLTNSFNIAAINNRILTVQLVGYPEDKNYLPEDKINTSEIVLKVIYHDGSEEYVYEGFDCIYDFAKDSSVTVRYLDFDSTFKVNLKKSHDIFTKDSFNSPGVVFLIVVLSIILIFILIFITRILIKKRIENSVEQV